MDSTHKWPVMREAFPCHDVDVIILYSKPITSKYADQQICIIIESLLWDYLPNITSASCSDHPVHTSPQNHSIDYGSKKKRILLQLYRRIPSWHVIILLLSSAVITRSSITWYCTHHCSDWGRVSFTFWPHKYIPNGRAMGCILGGIGRKLTAL